MQPYPHVYGVSARATPGGPVPVSAAGVPDLATAPPAEFDGPGDLWSPESLLVASVADCFILTFRGVARAARFEWEELECSVAGTLERVSGVAQFSSYVTRATLHVAPTADHRKAQELLERAEKVCLIANSLRGERRLEAEVIARAARADG